MENTSMKLMNWDKAYDVIEEIKEELSQGEFSDDYISSVAVSVSAMSVMSYKEVLTHLVEQEGSLNSQEDLNRFNADLERRFKCSTSEYGKVKIGYDLSEVDGGMRVLIKG
jgi:hypothetical protein